MQQETTAILQLKGLRRATELPELGAGVTQQRLRTTVSQSLRSWAMGLAGSAKDSNNSRQRKRERNVWASPFFFPSIFLQSLSLTKPKRSPLLGEPGKAARTGQCPLIQNWAEEGGNRLWGSTGTNPTLKTLKLPLGKGGVNRLYFSQDGRFRKNRRETCGTSLRSNYLSMRYSWLR